MRSITTLTISSENPLSTQLQRITGDSYNTIDFDSDSDLGYVQHKKTGQVFKILVDRSPNELLKHTRNHTAKAIANMTAPAIASLWKQVPDPTNLVDYAVREAIQSALNEKDPTAYKAWLYSDIEDPTEFFK